MTKYLIYISYWIINSAVIYLGSLIFKGNVVLVSIKYPLYFSAIAAGFVITLLVSLTLMYVESKGSKISDLIDYLIFFFIADTISIWITARFSDYFGFGIRNYRYAIILAIAMVVLQRLSFNYYHKMKARS